MGLATRKDLRRLTSELRRSDRDYPVVVLTVGERPDAPAFPPEAVRSRIGPQIPVYALGTPDLCRRLGQALSPRLAVDRGDARIFWPPVSAGDDAGEHPLVPARSETDGREPVERLVGALELSRPGVRGHVAVIQQRREAAEQRAAGALRELRDTRAELAATLARADRAQADRVTLERQLEALALAGLDEHELALIAAMDTDARLHRLICREWIRALASAADRETYPLGYVFGCGFISSVQELTGTPLERTAWVCAMVASGRAKAMPGIEPHHLRAGRAGSSEQLTRPDGAKAWTCKLNGEGASRLQYWARKDGLAEFAAAGVHDTIGQGV